MEKILLLKAEIREQTGTKSAIEVRSQGRVPVTIYGHKKEPVAVSLDAHSFTVGLHHGHRVLEIQTGEKKETVILKDLQYDYLGKRIIHADLMRVDTSEMIKVKVPLKLKGTAAGTHEGGIIEEHLSRLEVECKVIDIPESIVVSVKDIGVGDNLHASDIELPEGIKLVNDPTTLVLTCSLVAAAKSTEVEEAEEAATPEVIGEDKEAGEGASQE